jgi:hypothetical protein
LPDIHASLKRAGVRLIGAPRRDGDTFVYPTRGVTVVGDSSLRGTVTGRMEAAVAAEAGEWVVFEYAYHAGLRAEAP